MVLEFALENRMNETVSVAVSPTLLTVTEPGKIVTLSPNTTQTVTIEMGHAVGFDITSFKTSFELSLESATLGSQLFLGWPTSWETSLPVANRFTLGYVDHIEITPGSLSHVWVSSLYGNLGYKAGLSVSGEPLKYHVILETSGEVLWSISAPKYPVPL